MGESWWRTRVVRRHHDKRPVLVYVLHVQLQRQIVWVPIGREGGAGRGEGGAASRDLADYHLEKSLYDENIFFLKKSPPGTYKQKKTTTPPPPK